MMMDKLRKLPTHQECLKTWQRYTVTPIIQLLILIIACAIMICYINNQLTQHYRNFEQLEREIQQWHQLGYAGEILSSGGAPGRLAEAKETNRPTKYVQREKRNAKQQNRNADWRPSHRRPSSNILLNLGAGQRYRSDKATGLEIVPEISDNQQSTTTRIQNILTTKRSIYQHNSNLPSTTSARQLTRSANMQPIGTTGKGLDRLTYTHSQSEETAPVTGSLSGHLIQGKEQLSHSEQSPSEVNPPPSSAPTLYNEAADFDYEDSPEIVLPGPTNFAASYIHWGSSLCPKISTTVMKGLAMHYHVSSILEKKIQCVPRNERTINDHIEITSIGLKPISLGYDTSDAETVPCSICLSRKLISTMVPGQSFCPDNWEAEYSGYLMATSTDHSTGYTDPICVNQNIQKLHEITTKEAKHGGQLTYVRTGIISETDMEYGNDIIPCVVCTRNNKLYYGIHSSNSPNI